MPMDPAAGGFQLAPNARITMDRVTRSQCRTVGTSTHVLDVEYILDRLSYVPAPVGRRGNERQTISCRMSDGVTVEGGMAVAFAYSRGLGSFDGPSIARVYGMFQGTRTCNNAAIGSSAVTLAPRWRCSMHSGW